jgi:hypothetical protein
VLHWVSYLGLALLPLLVVLPFNLISFSWAFHHPNEPMPPELEARSRTIDRYVIIIREVILLVGILALMNYSGLPPSTIGLTLKRWKWNTLIGIVCGILQIGVQRLAWKSIPLGKRHTYIQRPLESSRLEAIFGDIISVFAQELWIAFSVVTLRLTGHSMGASLLLMATVFAIAHFPYKLGAVASGLYGMAYAGLFLWRISLLTPIVAHYIGNLGATFVARGTPHTKAVNE